jgi:purine-binding chemotaxis protein CheW
MSPSTLDATHAGKYLTVALGQEGYGIAALKVREIIRHQAITPVPQLPDFVKGVINLRGRVIPIVDLRTKFGLPAEVTDRSCIIVVQVANPRSASFHMGLVVDGVDEVVNITADQIEPTPDFGVITDTRHLLGMAKINGQVKTLLDLDRVLSSDAADELARHTTG